MGSSIFNCDESGFLANQGCKKVFCSREDKTTYTFTNNNDHQSYSVNVNKILHSFY